MIRLENLSKSFWVRGHRQTVIDNLTFTIPTGTSLALLGRNGAGKSTLLQMIAGSMRPTGGRILSTGSISWPIGFAGAFHRDMTGVQNIRFLARIYGIDSESLADFVRDFAELGDFFNMPIRNYSAGMRARIVFGAAMGIRFDTYLIDEVTAVGDAAFKAKSRAVFRHRVQGASAVMVSHNMREIREFCDAALILERGKLAFFDDIDEAIHAHETGLLT